MGYLARLLGLVSRAQRRGIAVWRAYADRKVDAPTASAVLATQILQSNSAASNLASLSFAAKQSAALQTVAPVPAIARPAGEPERLHKAAKTVLQVAEDSEDPEAIISRLLGSEAHNAATETLSAEVERSNHTSGFRRTVSANACQRCIKWAAGGKVFPPGTRFKTHPGCTCSPEPVFKR